MFQIKVVDFNEIYIVYDAPIFYASSLFEEKFKKSSFL
jgi:hypothetical protein